MSLSSSVVSVLYMLLLSGVLASQVPKRGIRSVDFANFTYRWSAGLSDKIEFFTLRNGELPEVRSTDGILVNMPVRLNGVKYGDVTRDNLEEAMVFQTIQTGGSASPGMLHIYTWAFGRPKLLWSVTTGDRADGGFLDAYAENGKLVLELNSPVGSRGDCCPIKFIRTHYRWNGKRFVPTKKRIYPIEQHQRPNTQSLITTRLCSEMGGAFYLPRKRHIGLDRQKFC